MRRNGSILQSIVTNPDSLKSPRKRTIPLIECRKTKAKRVAVQGSGQKMTATPASYQRLTNEKAAPRQLGDEVIVGRLICAR
jgi:hypothetical protein